MRNPQSEQFMSPIASKADMTAQRGPCLAMQGSDHRSSNIAQRDRTAMVSVAALKFPILLQKFPVIPKSSQF
jgi:hypothetical protein